MKNKFEKPELEIVLFESDLETDFIDASGPEAGGGNDYGGINIPINNP